MNAASSASDTEGAVVYPTTAFEVPIHRFRVMFTDGRVRDFLGSRDDSNIRGEMNKAHWGPKGPPSEKNRTNGIATVVDMGVEYIHTPAVPGIDTDKPRRRLRATKPPSGPSDE